MKPLMTVTLKVRFDLDAFEQEYGVAAINALEMVLERLANPGNYLYAEGWQGFAEVQSAHAQLELKLKPNL